MCIRVIILFCIPVLLSACSLDANIFQSSSTPSIRLKIVQDEASPLSTNTFDNQARFKIISTEELEASAFNPSIFKQNGTAKGLVFSLSPTTGKSKEFTLDVAVSSAPGSIEIEIPSGSVSFADHTANEQVVSPSVSKTMTQTEAKLALGFNHTCYIDVNNSVRCLGHAFEGQFGDGSGVDADRGVPGLIDSSLISGSVSIRKIVASAYGVCALNSDGAVYCWGDNYEGQAGTGTTGGLLIPTPLLVTNISGEKKFRDISTYYVTSCGITETDKLFCWGYIPYAGNSSEPQLMDLSALGSSVKVVQVSVGYSHVCGLSSDGRIFCFGSASSGQLGDGTTTARATPMWIDESSLPNGTSFKQVSVSENHSCALSFAGEIFCWGANNSGQLGDGTTGKRLVPTAVDRSLVPSSEVFSKVVAGRYLTCGLSSAGNAYCFGNNGDYTVGNGASQNALSPTQVDASLLPAGSKFKNIFMSQYRTCAETTNNQVACWGWENNYLSFFRETDPLKPFEISAPPLSSGSWKSFVAKYNYACGTSSDDTAYCWGEGTRVLGTGNSIETTPGPVDTSLMTGAKKFSQLAVSFSAVCGVATDGILYCWGGSSALGLGAVTVADVPTPVLTSDMTGATTFSQVSVGGRHACGVATDGKGYCWGEMTSSPGLYAPVLGNGSLALKNKPYPVYTANIASGSTLFSKIITTNFHSCGLMTDGVVYCWGAKDWTGGHSSTNMTTVPLPLDTSAMTGATTFSDIYGSDEAFCGTSTDGLPYCWGFNYYGLLGTGDTVSSADKVMPVDVSGISGPLTVSSMHAFYSFSCGILRSNSIYCWGSLLPSLGETIATAKKTPHLLDQGGGLNGSIVGLSGYNNIYALTDTGHLYCWGLDCKMGLPRTKPTLQVWPDY
ncbi:RCC1 domain-containing protein [Bdellovibrio bacteriovorus]|uniref:RCC1 domain-containing protein n=1 Tax=Bdellovibrio TaxID=958 RepID=UPI0035A861ED